MIFFQFEVILNILVLSAPFEYLCHGSSAIINVLLFQCVDRIYNLTYMSDCGVNPFKPEFTIVVFIHYKPRIAVAILDL